MLDLSVWELLVNQAARGVNRRSHHPQPTFDNIPAPPTPLLGPFYTSMSKARWPLPAPLTPNANAATNSVPSPASPSR